jgi:ribose 1,5-bisphosphokinase PhnN
MRYFSCMLHSRALITAFRRTVFHIHGLGSIRISEPLPASVRAWMERGNVTQLAVLGAENPAAMQVNQAENDMRHAALIDECRSRGYSYVHAVGVADNWQERHVVVAGTSCQEANEARRRYHQVAVLHATRDGVVQLILDEH